ncbi:LytTR family transcriptional regulator DNA-binding domain-containing protein [Prevotella sp.]|uniref:LytTR family transcriptional regulator DNA-binding domain-containing protein n=1 Tax=Prevotella sp. TaxID=59823 RepID=UPI002676DCF2
MQAKLRFSVYGELYVVDLNQTMYFKADDHYTHIYYTTGTHFMIPFGLSKVEDAIHEKQLFCKRFVRLGRTYIVNIGCIFHVNAMKQVLFVSDSRGVNHSIHLPKPVLRTLMGLLDEAVSQADK